MIKNYMYNNPDIVRATESKYPQTVEAFWTICHEQFELFCQKNNDYGPGNIAVGTNLTTEDDVKVSLSGLFFRIMDKAQRLKQLTVLNVKNSVGESITDTYQDISNYGIIAQIVQRKAWGK